VFIHEGDAEAHALAEGEWVFVETAAGRMKGKIAIRDDMPRNLIRVPHGWWKPESTRGRDHLSGAWDFADAQITRDDDDFLDREQGIPHLKGIPCRILKIELGLESAR
jgi:anaerobic selenocysteine-containing dehydrogenase